MFLVKCRAVLEHDRPNPKLSSLLCSRGLIVAIWILGIGWDCCWTTVHVASASSGHLVYNIPDNNRVAQIPDSLESYMWIINPIQSLPMDTKCFLALIGRLSLLLRNLSPREKKASWILLLVLYSIAKHLKSWACLSNRKSTRMLQPIPSKLFKKPSK